MAHSACNALGAWSVYLHMKAFDYASLENLSAEALDGLPFGVAKLAADGTVKQLNRAEAARLGMQQWRTIGRNYFRDLAGSAATRLSQAARELSPGARTSLELLHAGYRWNREGATVLVELCRMASGSLLVCVHPAPVAVEKN